MEQNRERAKIIMDALKQAGFQLMKEGRITDELLETVGQPFIPEEELRQTYDDTYRRVKSERT